MLKVHSNTPWIGLRYLTQCAEINSVNMNLCFSMGGIQGWNFKWRTLIKIAGNNQNLKKFMYSKLDFDGFCKILAVFDR